MPCSLQMQTVGICVRLLARLNGRAMSHTGLIPRWCWSIERWSTWFIIISWHSWGVYLYKLMVMITDVLCQWLLKISPPLQNSEFYSSAFMAFLSLAECRSPLSTSQFRSTTWGDWHMLNLPTSFPKGTSARTAEALKWRYQYLWKIGKKEIYQTWNHSPKSILDREKKDTWAVQELFCVGNFGY